MEKGRRIAKTHIFMGSVEPYQFWLKYWNNIHFAVENDIKIHKSK